MTISCPLGEDAPHDARNTRSAQQAFQTNFGQFGEVKDSGDKYGGWIQIVAWDTSTVVSQLLK